MLIWKLALRNIMRNKRRTALTVLLISTTLAILIFTDGYMKAMTDVMIRSATRLYPGDAQMHQVNYLPERNGENVITDVAAQLDRLNRNPEVESYSPRAFDFGMVSSTANNLPVQVVGVDANLEAQVSKLALSVVHGQYLTNEGDSQQILIGKKLAELLEVELGDRLVVSVNNYQLDDIDQRLFRVSGIFTMNSRIFDENLLFIQLPMAQEMLGVGDGVHEVAFNLVDEASSANEDLPLWAQLTTNSVNAQGWTTLLPDLAGMIALFDYSMLIVFVILFSVAVLGVVNAMFMSIFERTYEFGVLLAIGTQRRTLFSLILAEGFLLALVALVVGSILGAIATLWVGQVGIDYGNMDISGVALAEVLRPYLVFTQFIEYPLAVMTMTLVACLYPALFAARILPATALHKSL